MKKSKYADNIVFNEEKQEFDAYKKKYPTTVGSQSFDEIKVDKSSVKSAHNYFSSRLNEIQSEYNFQPNVGHKYYLYQRDNKTLWLSLVDPKSWNHKCLGCFQLLNSGKWKKLNL